MSAETRVLAMLGGVVLLQLLWIANRRVVEKYWRPGLEENAADADGADDDPEGDGDAD